MTTKLRIVCLFAVVFALLASTARAGEKFVLSDGWAIQSSGAVQETGNILSRTDFKPHGWYPARTLSTVLAALVADKIYPDPTSG